MKKKSIKVITVLLAMVMLFVSSSSVSAMSLQNTIAHRALKQQIIADKRQYCNFGMTTIKYVYADIDGDHVAELIKMCIRDRHYTNLHSAAKSAAQIVMKVFQFSTLLIK